MSNRILKLNAKTQRLIKKFILTLVCSLIITTNVLSQSCYWIPGYKLEDKDKGKIKSVTSSSHFLIDKFGEIVKGEATTLHGGIETAFRKFDKKGNIIEYATYNNECLLTTYKYNDKNNPTEILEYKFNCKSLVDFNNLKDYELSYKYIIKYDNNGNVIETKVYNGRDSLLICKTIYDYDAKENLVEKKHYRDGLLNLKFIYNYDENVKNEIEEHYDNGRIFCQYISKYDDKGNIIETNKYWYNYRYDKKEDKFKELEKIYLMEQNIIKYDNKGNIIEIERNEYKYDGSLSHKKKYNHKYDDKGNEIESYDGFLDLRNVYKYDNKGNEIENSCYKSDGSLYYKSTYEYKYDSKGNWIERIDYEGEAKIPKSINERKIEYYE